MTLRAMLGPQRVAPNVGPLLQRLGLDQRSVCAITAGWQEREGELHDLQEHIARKTADLQLYARAEELFGADPGFHESYRERQQTLRHMQTLYRRRLEHALAALREMEGEPDDSPLVRNERQAAMRAVRTLDRQHLRRIVSIRDSFERRVGPASRARIRQHADAIARHLSRCPVLLIAGGHVAVLLNRMRLFGLDRLVDQHAVIAWSAGAMTISEQIVLFHDHPPQGAGNAEIADVGLGLVPGVVPLPYASTRLALNDERRVSLFARRLSPARCVTLDAGATLVWDRQRLALATASFRLTRRGRLRPVATE
jgi:hypothetical protein